MVVLLSGVQFRCRIRRQTEDVVHLLCPAVRPVEVVLPRPDIGDFLCLREQVVASFERLLAPLSLGDIPGDTDDAGSLAVVGSNERAVLDPSYLAVGPADAVGHLAAGGRRQPVHGRLADLVTVVGVYRLEERVCPAREKVLAWPAPDGLVPGADELDLSARWVVRVADPDNVLQILAESFEQ